MSNPGSSKEKPPKDPLARLRNFDPKNHTAENSSDDDEMNNLPSEREEDDDLLQHIKETEQDPEVVEAFKRMLKRATHGGGTPTPPKPAPTQPTKDESFNPEVTNQKDGK